MKSPLVIAIASALMLPSVNAYAGGSEYLGAEFDTRLESVSTSDEIERQSLEVNYNNHGKGGLTYGVHASQHRIEDAGVDYDATELKAEAGLAIHDSLFFKGSIGHTTVEQKHGHYERELNPYHASVRAKFNQVEVGIEHGEDFTYRDQLITGDDGQILSAETTRVDAQLRPTHRVKLNAQTDKRRLSDGNRAHQHKLAAQYGVSPDWPWVWVGVEAKEVDYDEHRDGYWTPEKHRSVAATFASSFAVSESLEMSANASIGRGKEEHAVETGNTYYASIGANAKVSENAKLGAEAHYIKAQQDDSDWSEKGASLGLTVKHY